MEKIGNLDKMITSLDIFPYENFASNFDNKICY